jgi:hypothetical protein
MVWGESELTSEPQFQNLLHYPENALWNDWEQTGAMWAHHRPVFLDNPQKSPPPP